VVGALAGLDGDGVRGDRPGGDRGAQPGDDVDVGQVAVQEQDLDQGSGATGVAVRGAGGRQNASCAEVNVPSWRAWARAVAPARAPGLWARTSR
jgi:hypothetical protein